MQIQIIINLKCLLVVVFFENGERILETNFTMVNFLGGKVDIFIFDTLECVDLFFLAKDFPPYIEGQTTREVPNEWSRGLVGGGKGLGLYVTPMFFVVVFVIETSSFLQSGDPLDFRRPNETSITLLEFLYHSSTNLS